MSSFRPSQSAPEKFSSEIDFKSMSDDELRAAVRHIWDALNSRIDGLYPGGDDAGHWDYHKDAQNRKLKEEIARKDLKAKAAAGFVMAVVFVIVISFAGVGASLLGVLK